MKINSLRKEISQIKSSGKKVISYMSIGEAEDYRYYWDSTWNKTPSGLD